MQLANVRASGAAVFETDSVTGGRRVQGISRRANVDNIVNENALQRNESLTQNVMVNPMGMNAINPMEMNATETNVQTRINPSGQNTLTKANTLTNAINVQTHNVNQTRNMLTVAADVHTHHVSTSVGTQPNADIIGVSANRMILTEANDYAARPSSVTAAMSRDNTTRDLHVRMAGMNAANDSNIANNINAIHAPVQMVPVQMVPADNVSVQGGLSGQNVANAGTAQRVTDAANVAQSGFGAPQVTPGLPLVQGQSARDFLSVLQEVLSVKQNASGMSSTVTASSSAAAASSAAAQQAVPLTTQQAPAQQAPSIVTEGVTSLAPQTTLAAAASAAEAANTSSAGNASGPWLSLIPLVRSSLAPATWRTYVSHWKEWDQFCITRRAESSVSSQGMLGVRKASTRVWIVGHSFIHWAAIRALTRVGGQNLGFPASKASIRWLGFKGLCWPQLPNVLTDAHRRWGKPHIILIHLGGNDMGAIPSLELTKIIQSDLGWLRAWMPGVIIGWSNVIARRQWRYMGSSGAAYRVRKKLNRDVGAAVTGNQGFVVRHDAITADKRELYRPDGVHLSDVGLDLFLGDLSKTLAPFL
ncbi:uncharacterized protein LOC128652340 [Bombina bombina]|uniref:uncharacterized protein LOC128652340 n=1 Tax=Bombina bombina TaxID=8345 RepID=UPI00235A6800|nr:uncharacterized protein LOC128652340 [Bombina bombina]